MRSICCDYQAKSAEISHMRSKQLNLRMDAEEFENLGKVAEGTSLKPTVYAAMILGRFSDLRPEHALDALASIPKEFFKRGPGRPPATPRAAQIEPHIPTNDGR
jgi:hypothetical protein